MAEMLNARELGERSRAAVAAKDREGWLDLFAADGVVEDPIGVSPFDPEGRGHRGREGIAAFYDNVIAGSERVDFDIQESYLCGNEAAAVGTIRTTLAGGRTWPWSGASSPTTPTVRASWRPSVPTGSSTPWSWWRPDRPPGGSPGPDTPT